MKAGSRWFATSRSNAAAGPTSTSGPPERLTDVLWELDGPDVDALVQVGTNLSMVQLAAGTEKRLGKPVIAINTATYWHALRANGIDDKVKGLGQLLEVF